MHKLTAQRRNLTQVTFLYSVPEREIVGQAATSDLCTVVLQQFDVFKTVQPNRLLHYMSARRPVVVAVAGATCDLLARAGADLCVPPVARVLGDRMCRRAGRSLW